MKPVKWRFPEDIGVYKLCAPESGNNKETSRLQRHALQQKLKNKLLDFTGLSGFLYYDDQGKPFLLDGRHISISHSGRCTLLALAGTPVGIDYQIADERLLTLYPKFMHPGEEDRFDRRSLRDMLRLWTAKEAVYKLFGRPGISFRRDIRVENPARRLARVYFDERETEVNLIWREEENAMFCAAYK